MFKILILFFAFNVFALTSKKLAPEPFVTEGSSTSSSDIKFHNLSALVKFHRADLIFLTEAYVAFKPSKQGFVVISEKKEEITSLDELDESKMQLFIKPTHDLLIGQSYRLLIKFKSVDFGKNKNTIYRGELLTIIKGPLVH